MYFNANGEKVSRARWKEIYNAFKNRQELVKAGLTSRRDLMRMGLSTSRRGHADRQERLEQPRMGRHMGQRRQLLFRKQRLRQLRQSHNASVGDEYAHSAGKTAWIALSALTVPSSSSLLTTQSIPQLALRMKAARAHTSRRSVAMGIFPSLRQPCIK